MSTQRRFSPLDLFKFNNMAGPLRRDRARERHNHGIQLMMGKAEGVGKEWHGHVTAVTVAPEFRRLGLAAQMMAWLEEVSDKTYDAYFVDLFVRVSNSVAIDMYKRFGYSVYRRVIGYYAGPHDEDAFDMRKALPRDVKKESVVPLDRAVYPHEL
ncbi:MAG: acyl-CoA N-acyltransferase [Olpidium bornovanus]|uniref:Acyl-CoA N-acyltransferase n=1 Tax=Olpidium bornovanus TaxID=278681 RepID=A0A8H7ZR43_9FUNG|nr:MAG: acyl-CoA N-acyltransferase [Olpidium bornovanus]